MTAGDGQEALERLLFHLEHHDTGFSFALVVGKDRRSRARLREATDAWCSENGRSFFSYLPRPDDLVKLVIRLAESAEPGVHWIRTDGAHGAGETAAAQMLMAMNERREAYSRRIEGTIIVEGPPELKRALRDLAPDMFSIRSFVAEPESGWALASVSSWSTQNVSDYALADVRAAYRILHLYHRRLFNVLGQAAGAVARTFEPLNASWWGPYLWDRVPPERSRPTDKWVYDFIPLADAYFAWSPTRNPEVGRFFMSIWHSADDAVDNDARLIEPDPRTFPPVERSKTTLAVYVRAIVRSQHLSKHLTWAQLNSLVDEASSGGDDAALTDWTVKTYETEPVTIRYGGFHLSMDELTSVEAVDKRLVSPLLALIRETLRPGVSGDPQP